MNTALQFLEQMYLPSYMTVSNTDFSGNRLYFDFEPVEPPVTVLSEKYLTPRGTHIVVSQSGYCVLEKEIEKLGLDAKGLRDLTREGRLKLVEFNQRFRRELGLSETLQGRLTLTRLRAGKLPVIKLDFDLGERAVTGEMTGVIAPHSVPQTNADILRMN